MQEAVIDTKNIYSLTDFLRNYKAHIANLKATKAPELLTVNGRAEVVILDAGSYETLMKHVRDVETIARTRATFRRLRDASATDEPISSEDLERRHQALDELVAETERLGLYK
jgi:PHD/YefM family antitoxin component YafN of YafNO toxin-antitoxin module